MVDSKYVDWRRREERIDLTEYLSPVRDSLSPLGNPEATRSRAQSLSDSVGTGNIIKNILQIDLSNPEVADKVDAVLTVGAILVDVKGQTARPPYEEVSNRLLTATESLQKGDSGADDIKTAADRMGEIIDALLTTDETLRSIPNSDSEYSLDDAETARELVIDALSEGDVEEATRLHRLIVTGTWKKSHFERFDYLEFERLVAGLYQAHGYDVRRTEPGPDGGIDVIARDDPTLKLIQVKHVSDKVKAPQIDKHVSLFEYRDPDEVVMVTSSSFTEPALKRCRNASGRVRPINGEQLARLLSATDIVPPLGHE